ncbi:UDP-glucosyltransferase 2-like [Pieris napi]|uniref:UDP-glucosyltransferase 2-like n=1 Tax=Pieris napi TaxID=78633 RepID=UPI001FB93520|nr:UDP-glucosyltransferase 2-like [Pieris napi]
MQYSLLLAIIIGTLKFNDALRILVFFPISSKSHSILGYAAVDHLLKAGHEVVHITSFPRETLNPNYTRVVDVSEVGRQAKSATLNNKEGYTIGSQTKRKLGFKDALLFTYETHRRSFDHPEVIELLSDPNERFDAVIADWVHTDYVMGIAPLLQTHLIWLGTTDAYWEILQLIDGIPNPAVYIDLYSNNVTPLSFWHRAKELYYVIERCIYRSFWITPNEKASYYNQFGAMAKKRGVVMPSYEDAYYNASLMFLNTHPTLGTPFKLPQNAKCIAGYHISEHIPPLPQEFQKIMDNAKHGVIYFSMGSNLRSMDMTAFMKTSIMNMFGQLNETVIWKYESDWDNIPSNVHLVKWAPQQSILAHPNLKLFISHGGQLSTIEAIHFGVPIISIPVCGDQMINSVTLKNKGYGISVDLSGTRLASDLLAAINTMNANPKYKMKAKALSEAFLTRQQNPGEELVFWVEYVVKTGGATFLRSPALSIPIYKKLYLDLIALIFICHYLLKKYVWVAFKLRVSRKVIDKKKKLK